MLPLALSLLAESGSFSAQDVGIVLGAVITALLGGGFAGKKIGEARRVSVEPQPFAVKLQEEMHKEFVTRREFERLEASMSNAAVKMEGLFQRTMDAVEAHSKALTGKIERLGERMTKDLRESNASHQEARGRIHQKVNKHGEDIAALHREFSVSRSLGQFGEAILETVEASKQKSHEG